MRYGRALPTVAGALGVGVSLLIAGGPASATSPQEAANFLAVAHRGASQAAPELTMAAFQLAAESTPDRWEMDVQLSRDGVPVLMHDRTLQRTTNVEKVFPDRAEEPVGNFEYAELRRLDAGSWFDSRFAGESIPRLSDVLSLAAPEHIGLFLELKYPDDSPGLESTVATEFREDPNGQRLLTDGNVTFLSFEADSLDRMRAELSGPDLMWLNKTVPGPSQLNDLAGRVDWMGTDHRELDADAAERVHDAGLGLGVYTVNGTDNMCRSVGLGADAITSNQPDDLQAVRAGSVSC